MTKQILLFLDSYLSNFQSHQYFYKQDYLHTVTMVGYPCTRLSINLDNISRRRKTVFVAIYEAIQTEISSH